MPVLSTTEVVAPETVWKVFQVAPPSRLTSTTFVSGTVAWLQENVRLAPDVPAI
jgi:hypothetical protein